MESDSKRFGSRGTATVTGGRVYWGHRRAPRCVAPQQGSSAVKLDDFKGSVPVFLPEVFFLGSPEGWAVMESLIGGLQRRATITAHGKLEEDTDAVLFTETYQFDDGHSDTLHWT